MLKTSFFLYLSIFFINCFLWIKYLKLKVLHNTYILFQLFYYICQVFVDFNFVFYLFHWMHYCWMVFSTKFCSYLRKWLVCHTPTEVHSNLSWKRNIRTPLFTSYILNRYLKILRYNLLNPLYIILFTHTLTNKVF